MSRRQKATTPWCKDLIPKTEREDDTNAPRLQDAKTSTNQEKGWKDPQTETKEDVKMQRHQARVNQATHIQRKGFKLVYAKM